jgi:Protein of unknown function (DUF3060)
MQKLPNANALFAVISVCEHRWMKSEDDPEARIRELEQPLADAARASEAGGNPPPGKWAAPPAPAFPPPDYPRGPAAPPPDYPPGPAAPPAAPPPPYGGLFPRPSPAQSGSNRTMWIIAGVFIIGMIALPAAIFLFTAHQVSRSGISTLLPIPSISPEAPTPSGTMTPTGAAPSTSLTTAPTAPKGGNLSVAGINENRTIVCNDSSVDVSGVSNTVVITGHCASLSVSGVQNKVTVQSADSIQASGFNNEITYLAGSPQIDQSGQGNAIHKG